MLGFCLRGSHNLSVQMMLLDHDNVDRACVAERKEAEAAGAARGAITHDGAFEHFTILGEVLFERFYVMWLVDEEERLAGFGKSMSGRS